MTDLYTTDVATTFHDISPASGNWSSLSRSQQSAIYPSTKRALRAAGVIMVLTLSPIVGESDSRFIDRNRYVTSSFTSIYSPASGRRISISEARLLAAQILISAEKARINAIQEDSQREFTLGEID